jgi:hypothetical protein
MARRVKAAFLDAARIVEMERSELKKTVQKWSRSRKLVAFAKGPQLLSQTLKRFPKAMWGYTQKKGNWTIIQVLWHLADQEANLYVRLRRAIAEPGEMISPYDQNLWDQKLLYAQADPSQARDLILLLRMANTDLLKRVPAVSWKGKVKHPEWGSLSLEYWVGFNIWHFEHHLGQMERRYQEWKSR